MDPSASALDVLLAQIRYEHRTRVRDDVLAVLDDVRSLMPLLGTLISNDGAESRLLLLSGTIPIYFQAVQYNIPIDVFVPEAYPRQPPKMYVRPTSNMIVHPNHAQVDKEGMVYLPYLADWHAHAAAGNLDASPMGGRGGYNLSELLVLVASVFSEHPPLFTRPPAAVPVQSSPVALGTAVALSSSFSASSGSIHAAASHTPHAQRPAARSQREILEEQLTARLQVCRCHEIMRPPFSCLLFPDFMLLLPCDVLSGACGTRTPASGPTSTRSSPCKRSWKGPRPPLGRTSPPWRG
jgi:ESCRT-I complex subunit TSG101